MSEFLAYFNAIGLVVNLAIIAGAAYYVREAKRTREAVRQLVKPRFPSTAVDTIRVGPGAPFTGPWCPRVVFVATVKNVHWSEEFLADALPKWNDYSYCTIEYEYVNGDRRPISDIELLVPWAPR